MCRRTEYYSTTIASITTERSPIRDIFFSSPGYGTIASLSSTACQYDFIDEHKYEYLEFSI